MNGGRRACTVPGRGDGGGVSSRRCPPSPAPGLDRLWLPAHCSIAFSSGAFPGTSLDPFSSRWCALHAASSYLERRPDHQLAGIHAEPIARRSSAVLHRARLDFAVRAQGAQVGEGTVRGPGRRSARDQRRNQASATAGSAAIARRARTRWTSPCCTRPSGEEDSAAWSTAPKLVSLLRECEYVVCALPSTDSTRNLLSFERSASKRRSRDQRRSRRCDRRARARTPSRCMRIRGRRSTSSRKSRCRPAHHSGHSRTCWSCPT